MNRSLYDIHSEINSLFDEVKRCEALDQAIKFLGLVMEFGTRLNELKKLVYSGNQDPDILKECSFGVVWWAMLGAATDLIENGEKSLDKKASRAAILSRIDPHAMSALNLNGALGGEDEK